MSFAIIPPVPNFAGVIKDFEDNILGPGWLNIERIDNNGYYSGWYGMEIDQNGEFGMKLVEGDTYIIRDAWVRDESAMDPWMNQTRYSFNRKVVIGNDTSELILKPNTKMLVDLGGELEVNEEMNWYNISANVRKVIDASDPDFENYQRNPWMYETWVDLEYNSELDIYEAIHILIWGHMN